MIAISAAVFLASVYDDDDDVHCYSIVSEMCSVFGKSQRGQLIASFHSLNHYEDGGDGGSSYDQSCLWGN